MTDSTFTTVYRSNTKSGLYIYLGYDKEISDLPDELIKRIGKYTKVMELNLDDRDALANEDIKKVKTNLLEKGYHLQIPNDIIKNVITFK